ncbi:hypothetical protein NQ318_022135 [Aromia moschata]|uniref:Uncharacterized protein n=1 Tax=Aromia moschata TaxID=1265417 RepID=A0AAV8Z7I2_9CUCU|nr:hypothetical protein NQ318_022135 [Aromia moschata]
MCQVTVQFVIWCKSLKQVVCLLTNQGSGIDAEVMLKRECVKNQPQVILQVLVRCAQLKELLLLPKVCVKTQERQLVAEHNNLIGRSNSALKLINPRKTPELVEDVDSSCHVLSMQIQMHHKNSCSKQDWVSTLVSVIHINELTDLQIS